YNDAIKLSAERHSALVFLNADMIYSDGTFASIAKRASEGKRCVEIDGFRTKKQGMEAALRSAFRDIIAIQPSHLVQLSLEHIHSISLSHIWEAEGDGGFIPFHTYWRAGSHGLVGKLSHLYPLYLYPRNWNIGAARTIDWDLIERAGLHEDDIHIVTDSNELFVAELSDENYVIAPTFPEGGSIRGMRRFIADSCSPHHRACLDYSSRLKANSEGRLSWWWAEFKAFVWMRAVRDHSILCAIALRLFELPTRIWRLAERAFLYATAYSRVLRNREAITKSRRMLAFITRSDPGPYLVMLNAAPSGLRPLLQKPGLPLPLNKAELTALNSFYERSCLENESPVPLTQSIDLMLARDAYYGTSWRLPRGYPARQIGKDGYASAFFRLEPKRTYNVLVTVAKIPFELGNRLKVLINDEIVSRQRIECSDTWKVRAVIPPSSLERHSGRIKLTVSVDSTRERDFDVFVSRIQITQLTSVKQSVLVQHGLCETLYSSFKDSDYRQAYDNCPQSAEWDPAAAETWISGLHQVLSTKTLPLAALSQEPTSEILLGENILGYGWSPASMWGSQSFRYISERTAAVFVRVCSGTACRLKAYLYSCPSDLLETLKLKVDGDLSLPQALEWETDRYVLWVDVPPSATKKGVIELTIVSTVNASDCIAFSRIAIVKRDEMKT
ncbi:hypothetical protein MXD81_53360, partial [Microbacteriaceae bacterium K1510]|nr:hypothetical protein [Microbacteriaceae bacterium K1510]